MILIFASLVITGGMVISLFCLDLIQQKELKRRGLTYEDIARCPFSNTV